MGLTTKEKFLKGEELTSDEIRELDDVDKCRYVCDMYFSEGFNAHMITVKLNELLPGNEYSPMEVRDWLVEFYGEPGL